MSNDSSSSVGPLASAIEAALMELLRLDPGTASIRIAPTAGGSVVVLQQAEASGEANAGVGRDSPTSIGSGDSSSRTDVDEDAAAGTAGRHGAARSAGRRHATGVADARHASSHGQRASEVASHGGPADARASGAATGSASGSSGYTGRSWRTGWRFTRPQAQYGGTAPVMTRPTLTSLALQRAATFGRGWLLPVALSKRGAHGPIRQPLARWQAESEA